MSSEHRLLTPGEVAALVGVKENTLSVWRSEGRYGLRFIKVGSLVRYDRRDVEAWLAARSSVCVERDDE